MIALLKDALNLLQPLSLVWIGLFVFAVWLFRQQQRKAAKVAAALWVFLSLVTCMPFCTLLLTRLERPWFDISRRWDQLPVCDAIVCLGGGVASSSQEIIGLNMIDASDRITTAAELLRRGKAPRLIISGGASRRKVQEADAVRDWIQHWQLTTAEVSSLGPCADTHDEAERVAALAKEKGWKRVLLVTSASHMKRAQSVFQKSCGGVEIVAGPCGFMTDPKVEQWFFLPNPGELENFSIWFHEAVGWWVYRARGWI